jgi:UDP-N-acetylglucosamine 4,6-dehydratase
LNLLITGGTGTFGKAFLPTALDAGIFERIAIYSRDEDKQFRLRRELNDDPRLRWFIGDIRDRDRLVLALRGVDVVVHAAALKHVIAAEYNPTEAVATNIGGAQNLVRAAIDADVQKVIALSTDKAVEPINLYGATKMCMEKILMASNVLAPGRTAFSCVRYGNVLGSRGSFIETLKRLRDEGAKSFPLRSIESTRFWMEPEDAAQFVLDRLLEMQGSEIFVPKLPSSTAYEFAKMYLPDATPEIVGVPRGEKIHEILISHEEWGFTDDEGSHYTIRPNGPRKPIKTGIYASNQNPFNALNLHEPRGDQGRVEALGEAGVVSDGRKSLRHS